MDVFPQELTELEGKEQQTAKSQPKPISTKDVFKGTSRQTPVTIVPPTAA